MVELDLVEDGRVIELIGKIKAIWDKWKAMNGDNRPLERSKAGPRRDFDINIDGMAHYGMLPDFLQDLRNVGLTAEDLAPLFRSAYDYMQMWTDLRAERRGCQSPGREHEMNRMENPASPQRRKAYDPGRFL